MNPAAEAAGNRSPREAFTKPRFPLIAAPMKPETERTIDEIQQAIALLRRHL
jgi:hypothetical protein